MDATLVGKSILCPSGYGYRKRECESVVSWFVETYLPNYQLTIDVVHRGLKKESVVGYCSTEDIPSRPRTFLIELQTYMDKTLYRTTLLHELWHMFQMVKGDLKHKNGHKYWKSETIDHLEYCDDPSELEAYRMEDFLLEEYQMRGETVTFFPNRLTDYSV